MTKKQKKLALLPNGFVDLLPPEAGQEAAAITTLIRIFEAYGYNRIKPPLVEFEDSLLAPGPGAALADETFRLMDPVSHRMMGIRSDITPQTARIASSRLAGEERPLRLAYANDVLRTRASQQRLERQFCQVGCELIGPSDAQADIEVCVLALSGLNALELKDVSIDLALPRLLDKIPAAKDEAVRLALSRRDRGVLFKLKSDSKALFKGLLESSGKAEDALKKLKTLKLPKSAKADVAQLEKIYKGLKTALKQLGLGDVAITLDPLENKGFEYHGDFAFTLFAKSVRGELGRGGRYDVRFGDGKKPESATGFTLYMDTIRKALPPVKKQQKIFVSQEESWAVIQKLQADGWIVVRGAGKTKTPKTSTHIYKNGNIEKAKASK